MRSLYSRHSVNETIPADRRAVVLAGVVAAAAAAALIVGVVRYRQVMG